MMRSLLTTCVLLALLASGCAAAEGNENTADDAVQIDVEANQTTAAAKVIRDGKLTAEEYLDVELHLVDRSNK
jgi:hypothetical protein